MWQSGHGLMICFIGTIITIRVERGRKKSGRKEEESTEREREVRLYKDWKKINKIDENFRRGRDERMRRRQKWKSDEY